MLQRSIIVGSLSAVLACLALASSLMAAQQSAGKPGTDEAVTLAQYRQWYVAAHTAAPAPVKKGTAPAPAQVDLRPADEAFLQVLTLQARAAAARQSQDRLAGWISAIKPRLDNQSIAALDVEILALAERRTASDVARLESDLRRAVESANVLAARAKGSSLLATVDTAAVGGPDAEGLAAMEKDVLVRGRDLLVKMFQSFTVGGVEITELLWYEAQAKDAEASYRVWSTRAGFDRVAVVAGR